MPIITWAPDGAVLFDSREATAGVCIGIFRANGTPQEWTFPDYIGASLTLVVGAGVAGDSFGFLARLTYPAGMPTLTLTPNEHLPEVEVSLWATSPPTVPVQGIKVTVPSQNGDGIALAQQSHGLYWRRTLNNISFVNPGLSLTPGYLPPESDAPIPIAAWVCTPGLGAGEVLVLELRNDTVTRMDWISPSTVAIRSTNLYSNAQVFPILHVFGKLRAGEGADSKFLLSDRSGAPSWDLMRTGMLRCQVLMKLDDRSMPVAVPGGTRLGVAGGYPSSAVNETTERWQVGTRFVGYDQDNNPIYEPVYEEMRKQVSPMMRYVWTRGDGYVGMAYKYDEVVAQSIPGPRRKFQAGADSHSFIVNLNRI